MKVTGLSEKRKMSALLFCCLLIVLINLTIMWLALLPMLKDCGSDHVSVSVKFDAFSSTLFGKTV